jgi:hypothetical protein
MNKTLVIARNTFREAIRDRILYLILVFAVALILFSRALGWVSVGVDAEVILDVSLFAISALSLVVAIFVGTGLIYKELDKRTIYTILSKPVDRWHFVLGKYLGLTFTLMLVALAMEVFLVVFLWTQGFLPGGDGLRMLWYSLLLIHGEIIIVTAVAITLSLITNPVLSAVLTLVVWVAGNASDELANLGDTLGELARTEGESGFELTRPLVRGIYCLTPHLNYFSETKRLVSWPDPEAIAQITAATAGGRMLYAIAYAGVLLCISVWWFRRRSF